MRKTLATLLDRAADWPEDAQAELIESMIAIEERHVGLYRLSEEERAAVRRGVQDVRNGNLATDEEVAAVFARHRRT